MLQVIPNSPAYEAGVEPYFDYITHVNGISLTSGTIEGQTPTSNSTRRTSIKLNKSDVQAASFLLSSLIHSNVSKRVEFTIFSTKHEESRTIGIIPEYHDYGLLGCSVKYCDFSGMAYHVWRILSIYPSSPAETAGLNAESDYILGSADRPLYDQDDLYELIRTNVKSPVRLYVYNTELDSIREVFVKKA